MIEFASGYALGFVSGMAVRNFESARRLTAVGLEVLISGLDVVHRAVLGKENEFRKMLDKIEKTAADVHSKAEVKRAAA